MMLSIIYKIDYVINNELGSGFYDVAVALSITFALGILLKYFREPLYTFIINSIKTKSF